jgi:Mg2+/Co2+ transporter CorC
VIAGHVPATGECVDHPSGWKLEVTEADERRIHRLRLHPPVALEVDEE